MFSPLNYSKKVDQEEKSIMLDCRSPSNDDIICGSSLLMSQRLESIVALDDILHSNHPCFHHQSLRKLFSLGGSKQLLNCIHRVLATKA